MLSDIFTETKHMDKKSVLTIPNILSFYRLLTFPWVLYLALSGHEYLYVVFLVINLITDALDGIIARAFRMETEFGARLDTLADIGMYITAIVGIFQFKTEEFSPHLLSLGIYVFVFIVSILVPVVRFGRFPSLHLYSSKIGGYLQGIFFFVLFISEFYTPFYYLVITWAILAFCEQICVQLVVKRFVTNAKGLYWVLKDKTGKE